MAAAGAASARALSVPDIIAAAEAEAESAARVPELPADCRRREGSGVARGDRLDAAALKADSALGRANARLARCAAWHDAIRERGTGS